MPDNRAVAISAASSRSERELWPDLAKAACIILVVLWHVTSKSLAQLADGSVVTAYQDVSAVLQPVRIPLFFTISGLFSAAAIARPWRQTWRVPVTRYWLYVVWTLVHTGIFLALPLATNSADSPKHLAYALALGYTSLWYLFALALYFVAGKVLRRFPIPTLAIAAVASVVGFYDVLPEIGNTDSILQNGVFFLAAAYVPRAMAGRLLGSATWLRGALLTVVFLGGAIAALMLDELANPAAALVLSVVGVAAAITVATLIPDTRASRWVAEKIGARTIAIYVLHLPFLAALMYVLDSVSGPVAVVYPLVVTAAIVALGLLVYVPLNRIAPWLFALPQISTRPETPPVEDRARHRA